MSGPRRVRVAVDPAGWRSISPGSPGWRSIPPGWRSISPRVAWVAVDPARLAVDPARVAWVAVRVARLAVDPGFVRHLRVSIRVSTALVGNGITFLLTQRANASAKTLS